jgi:hypothetical protein
MDGGSSMTSINGTKATRMRHYRQGRFRQQVQVPRRQFLQGGDLPFTDILTEAVLAPALAALRAGWLDRLLSPLVTLWVFLGKILSADHSCRAAVARLIAHRLARGQRPCSAATGAYCQARQRLPEEFFAAAARSVGSAHRFRPWIAFRYYHMPQNKCRSSLPLGSTQCREAIRPDRGPSVNDRKICPTPFASGPLTGRHETASG